MFSFMEIPEASEFRYLSLVTTIVDELAGELKPLNTLNHVNHTTRVLNSFKERILCPITIGVQKD